MTNSSRGLESPSAKHLLLAEWTREFRLMDVGPRLHRNAYIVFSGILILALWIDLHPYRGLVHDARLYAVQALSILNDEAYRNDLYFKYGSQDQFILFSRLHAYVISLLGLSTAQLVLTILAQSFWLAALVFLVFSLIAEPRQAILGVALAIALPSGYGGLQIFRYGEPFLSPRLLAEALTMLGLGLMLRRRPVLTWLVLVAATIAHPLMAAPGVAFVFIYAILSDRRWLWAPAGFAACFAALAFLGVQPFARALETFDPEWLRIVEERSRHVFVAQWTILDFARLVSTLGLASVAMLFAEARLRKFVAIAILVGLGGTVATVVGGDVAHNIFVTDAQPWRSLWVLVLAANIAAGPIVWQALVGAWETMTLSRPIVLAGLAMLVASRLTPGFLIVPPFIFLLGLPVLYREGFEANAPRRLIEKLSVLFLMLLGLGLAGKIVSLFRPPPDVWASYLEIVVIPAALGIIATFLSAPERGQLYRPLSIVVPVMLFLSACAWDRRADFEHFIESDSGPPAELTTLLPAKANVYWENGVELLWFRLRRPSYFSCMQGTGAVFFRQTAIDYNHRIESFEELQTSDFENLPGSLCPTKRAASVPSPSRDSIGRLCGREPALDYLVLTAPIDRAYFAEWQSPVPLAAPQVRGSDDNRQVWPRLVDRFYLYRCSDLRARSTTEPAGRSDLLPG